MNTETAAIRDDNTTKARLISEYTGRNLFIDASQVYKGSEPRFNRWVFMLKIDGVTASPALSARQMNSVLESMLTVAMAAYQNGSK